MNEILDLLVLHWRFLWARGAHQIIEGYLDPSFPGAVLDVQSSAVSLRFTRDRSAIEIEVRPRWVAESDPWMSFYWLQALLSGWDEILGDRESVAAFYDERRPEIDALFADRVAYEAAVSRIGELAKAAADKRWGPIKPEV